MVGVRRLTNVEMQIHQALYLPLDLLFRKARVGQQYIHQHRTDALDEALGQRPVLIEAPMVEIALAVQLRDHMVNG